MGVVIDQLADLGQAGRVALLPAGLSRRRGRVCVLRPLEARPWGRALGKEGRRNVVSSLTSGGIVWDAVHCIVFICVVSLTLVFHTQLILPPSSLYLSLCIYARLVPLAHSLS